MKTYKIILIVLGLIVFVILFFEIIYPSYLSYTFECLGGFPLGAKLLGYERRGYFNTNTKEIFIVDDCGEEVKFNETMNLTREEEVIIKHELCHKSQQDSGRIHNCSSPIWFFVEEVECYVRERF